MRANDFQQVMAEARKFGTRLASLELKKVVFEVFGTTDRERCKKECKAFCGVRVVAGYDERELWYCVDKFGEVFASENIEDAYPFSMYPMKAEKEETRRTIARFAGDVEREFRSK